GETVNAEHEPAENGERQESQSGRARQLDQALAHRRCHEKGDDTEEEQNDAGYRREVWIFDELIGTYSGNTGKSCQIGRARTFPKIEEQKEGGDVEEEERHVGRYAPKEVEAEAGIDVGKCQQQCDPGT